MTGVKKTKRIDCPECKSLNTESSWGSSGYMQCNKCGHEWIQSKPRKLKAKKKVN